MKNVFGWIASTYARISWWLKTRKARKTVKSLYRFTETAKLAGESLNELGAALQNVGMNNANSNRSNT